MSRNNRFKPLIISVLTAFVYLLVLSNSTASWASPKAVEPNKSQLVRAIGLIKNGDFKKAEKIVNNIIESEPKNQQTVALSWQVLGNALNGSGQYQKAIVAYRQSLSLRSSLPVYNNLVKASISYRLENSVSPKTIEPNSQIWRDAIKTVEMGDRQNTISSIFAYTNWVDLTGNKISGKRLKHARKILDRASPSRALIYASINWGSKVEPEHQLKWLIRARSAAFFLDDKLAQAQVLLELGNFYSQQGNLSLALQYANQTINLAATNAYYSISYRAERLAGQTYQQQRKFRAALRAYKNAIVSLEAIDKDLYVSKSSVQIARFKTESAIVYKRAIELLLKDNPTSSQLKEVLDISGKLRITELQSFFGDDCLEISSKTVDNVDSQATPKRSSSPTSWPTACLLTSMRRASSVSRVPSRSTWGKRAVCEVRIGTPKRSRAWAIPWSLSSRAHRNSSWATLARLARSSRAFRDSAGSLISGSARL